MTASQLGDTLREARQRRGVSIDQLSRETTIPVNDIEALEAGAIDALPRAMYRRAEARAYAEAVGLDADVVLTHLRLAERRETTAEAPACAPAPDAPPPPELLRAPAPVVLAPAPGTADTTLSGGDRIGRALFILLFGCATLLSGRTGDTSPELAIESAVMLPAITPSAVLDQAVRIAEPPAPAPSLRRAFYEPGVATPGQHSPDGRLDEGVLVVQSTPGGARVTVNGVGWGVTPVAIRYLPMGPMRVRIAKDDYVVQERLVALTADQPSSTLRVSLSPLRRATQAAGAATGDMLVITSVPDGARVTVNGIGWGRTPLTIRHLPPGEQRVRIVKDQFRSEERVVTVSPEQPRRLAVTLKPLS